MIIEKDKISQREVYMDNQIETYRDLSKHFSLLPLEYNSLSPVSKKWRGRCLNKVNFVEKEYIDEDGRIRNAGIACGRASKIIVIKRKNTNNFKAWQILNEMTNTFPETFTVSYGDDIDFFYYQYPQGGRIYETKSCLYDIDILAVNAFVPVPGTTDPQSWIQYYISKDISIAILPQWIIDVLSGKDRFKTLESEVDKVIFDKYEHPFKILNPEFNREAKFKARQAVQMRIGLAIEDNSTIESNQKQLTGLSSYHDDTVGKFIENMCETGQSHAIKSSQLNKAYQNWCYQNGKKLLGKHSITTIMNGKGFIKKKTGGTEHWLGLKLK